MRIIDLKSWNRKEHYEFFSSFDEPFFGLVAKVDCSFDMMESKKNQWSFFSKYLHKSLKAVNQIDEFRYRILGENVVEYDTIHASSTIGRADGTFGYSFVEFDNNFEVFNENLQSEIESVQNSSGLCLSENTNRQDTIHYSSLPWVDFTGLTHARDFKRNDSVPKISFGKAITIDKVTKMSVAVYVHHGLADGYHLGKFFELFQSLLNKE